MLGVWWRLLFDRQVGVVQVLMDVDYAVAACLAGHAHRTVIMWATEGDPVRSFAGPKGAIRKALIRGCGHVVLTARMQLELADECGIRRSREIIPVPVDSSRFRPATDDERADERDASGDHRDHRYRIQWASCPPKRRGSPYVSVPGDGR